MLKKLFARINGKKQVVALDEDHKLTKVFCDTKELENALDAWKNSVDIDCQSKDVLDFEDVAKILGLETPLWLSHYDRDNSSFRCIEISKCEQPGYKPIEIQLISASRIDFRSIVISDGNTKKWFAVEDRKEKDKATSNVKIVRMTAESKDGRMLEIHYFIDNVEILVELDDNYELNINCHPVEFRNQEELIQYLLDLSSKVNILNVYSSIVSYISSHYIENIRIELLKKILPENADKLTSSEISCGTKKEVITSMQALQASNPRKFILFKNCETFIVKSDGKWEYNCKGIKISYDNDYFIYGRGDIPEKITNLNSLENMERVMEEVNSIIKHVG